MYPIRRSFLAHLVVASLLGACDGGPGGPPVPPPIPSEWSWVRLDLPPGVSVESLYVHPSSGVLLASHLQRGTWASHDDGESWVQVLSFGVNWEAVQADPDRTERIWVGAWDTLQVSTDGGRSFTPRNTFPRAIRSIHVSELDGAIFVAPQWESDDVPGIFRSLDDGATFEFFPYGVEDGLRILTWDIEEDSATGALFLANEIADHPQPYDPPLLRSMDRGQTWTDVSGPLFWHAQSLGMNREEGILYVLLEGPGLWSSTDLGRTWERLSLSIGTTALLVDPFRPAHVYVGERVGGSLPPAGLYFSLTGGGDMRRLDFPGFDVTDIAIGPGGLRLYVVAGGQLYVAELPDRFRGVLNHENG